MTLTEKYNFNIKINQHHTVVDNITQQCKTFFESTNYKLLIDYPFPTIGGDGLLIYKYND